jgi:2-polyprenyl-6-methoxyphenol hydroxylase-like FAD-dependent oxidoreductase
MTRALIVGGGIGGLTTALWLQGVGVEVTIFEAVPDMQPLGVGINLLPHATKVLHQLGLLDRLEATAILTRELRYHSKDGKTIWVEPRGRYAGYQTPQYSIHRGRLQMLLLAAVKERLGAQSVLTDHRLVGFEQSEANGVVAHFARAQTGSAVVSVRGDILIGADGLHSAVRSHFYPHEGPPQFSGQMLWRGAVETEPFMGGDTMVMIGANDLKAVIYPIGREAVDRGRSLVNWVAERRLGKDSLRGQESWNKRGDKAEFAPYFHDWRFPWLDVPKLFAETREVFEFPMVDRDPVPQWSFGRVTLLGDAAHAMYPNGSNGGSQAIVDAEALAAAVSSTGDVAASLRAYEQTRIGPTTKLVLDNRQTGPERVLQMVDERCSGTCGEVHSCVPQAELQAVAQAYKRLAGFDRDTVNRRG